MATGQDRIDEAIAYIGGMGKPELAIHLERTVRRGNMSGIDRELSLGSRPDGKDDPGYAANTQRRQALRALLLCQRVYFSELWWTAGLVGGEMKKVSMLEADWKLHSLRHWGNRSEAEITEAILTFTTTSDSRDALVSACDQAPNPKGVHPDLTLTRARTPFPGLMSCYGSVMTWLFRSGLVSYRWYALNNGASGERSLRTAFGLARIIIGPDQPFTPTSVFPNVPAGYIVHLYAEESRGIRWNGHWLVSLGGGTGRGCNNDTTDGTPNVYTPGCSLAAQFLNGYRDEKQGSGGEHWRGIAEVIDPLQIPDRI